MAVKETWQAGQSLVCNYRVPVQLVGAFFNLMLGIALSLFAGVYLFLGDKGEMDTGLGITIRQLEFFVLGPTLLPIGFVCLFFAARQILAFVNEEIRIEDGTIMWRDLLRRSRISVPLVDIIPQSFKEDKWAGWMRILTPLGAIQWGAQ